MGPAPAGRDAAAILVLLSLSACITGCAAGFGSGSAESGSAAGSGFPPAPASAGDKVLSAGKKNNPAAGAKVSATRAIPASIGSVEDGLKSELYVSSADMKLFKSVCLPESTDSDATRAAAAKELGIDPIHKAYFDLFSRIPEPNTRKPYWMSCHNGNVKKYRANDAASPEDKWQFLMVGDSLTEVWAGTKGCDPEGERAAFPTLRVETFGPEPQTKVIGMSAEDSWNMAWATDKGEMVGSSSSCPRVLQIYIGSNDFAAARADSGPDCRPAYAPLVAESVIGVAERWRTSCPRTKIIMRGLSIYGVSSGSWPNLYTVAYQEFNARIKDYANSKTNLHYLVCGWNAGRDGLLAKMSSTYYVIRPGMYAKDGFHPSLAGMEMQASCMKPLVDSLMAESLSERPATPSRAPRRVPEPSPAPAPAPDPSPAPPPMSASSKKIASLGKIYAPLATPAVAPALEAPSSVGPSPAGGPSSGGPSPAEAPISGNATTVPAPAPALTKVFKNVTALPSIASPPPPIACSTCVTSSAVAGVTGPMAAGLLSAVAACAVLLL